LKIVIIGSGYVGLTTGVCLAYLGNRVTLLDPDTRKIEQLQKGIVPFYEPGLTEILHKASNNLEYIDGWDDFDTMSDIVMIAVGTPPKSTGEADLSIVEEVAGSLGARITEAANPIIVNKSTVPIGTAAWVKNIVEQNLRRRGINKAVHVASNPEFLREGEALADTFYPDRIVIGVSSQFAGEVLCALYQPLAEQAFELPYRVSRPAGSKSPPTIMVTTPTNSELIKYVANSFLAVKISFINEFANFTERMGGDILEVAKGIGLDPRIGPRFLNAGIGWGGSCFGKDTGSVIFTGEQYDCEMQLLRAAIDVNYRQRELVIKKLKTHLRALRGRTIGMLGLAFKPNTDDLRDAPALDIIRLLNQEGAHVKAYDPVAMNACRTQYPSLQTEYCATAEKLFEGCHAVVLVTEWREFLNLPYPELGKRMAVQLIIDGRNVLAGHRLHESGFHYCGVGRRDERWEKGYLSPVELVL